MARDAEIDAGYEEVPSPQWVSGFSSSVDKGDISSERDVSSRVKLLVNMKKSAQPFALKALWSSNFSRREHDLARLSHYAQLDMRCYALQRPAACLGHCAAARGELK